MHILEPDRYHAAKRAAIALRDQGMALSVLAGVRPGIVAVDNPEASAAVFIGAPEGGFAWTYLAGDPGDAGFRRELRTWLFEARGLGADVGFSFLTCDRAEWEGVLGDLLAPRTVIPDRRLHYECHVPPTAEPPVIPAGYRIADVDRPLLDSKVTMHPQVLDWMSANFGSADRFLERGIGAVALCGEAVVGWILADSFADGVCDIGGEVEEAHRRKGLAYAATRRCVAQAFDRGARRIGWHCHAINIPSVKTAEKAGFELKRAYTVYPIQFDPEKHEKLAGIVAGEYAEDAADALSRGKYEEADGTLSRLLGFLREPAPDVLHSAARAAAGVGDVDRALARLKQAVAAGWTNANVTQSRSEFAPLHDDPRWAAALEGMESGS